MSHWFWDTLDIDPTTDRAVIRRAYAARLRAMDVDADPDGFALLRDARDSALAHGADGAAAPPVAVAMPVDEPPLPDPEPPIDPHEQAHRAAIEDHFHALESLLFPGHDTPAAPEEAVAIADHGRALLADPRLEQVDFAAGAERWFAEHLAASVPRSDPLLEPAAAAFGWIERRKDYALSADAHAVVERIGAMRFAALVSDPAHRLHRAWRELTRPDGARRDWRVTRGRVRELLTLVRQRYPGAETWMDPARVAAWDKRTGSGRAGFPVWVILFIVVAAIRIGMGVDDRVSPPDPPIMVRPTADPDRLARDLTGIGIDGVAAINPGLASDIRATAGSIGAAAGYDVARALLQTLFDRRIAGGLAAAPDPLLRDVATFEVAAKERLAGSDPARCRTFGFPSNDPTLPFDVVTQQRGLLPRVVLASTAGRLDGREVRYRVPGDMIETIGRSTGLPRARIDAALLGQGEDRAICRVQIALLRVALAGGAPGMALLRDMQPSADDVRPE